MCRPWREARTTSLPHGEMEAEPTGLSKLNEPSWPNVGLSKADARPFRPSNFAIVVSSFPARARTGLHRQRKTIDSVVV